MNLISSRIAACFLEALGGLTERFVHCLRVAFLLSHPIAE
jgi:hypothetical protein